MPSVSPLHELRAFQERYCHDEGSNNDERERRRGLAQIGPSEPVGGPEPVGPVRKSGTAISIKILDPAHHARPKAALSFVEEGAMFRFIEDLPPNVMGIEAIGKITHEDYRDTFIPIAEAMIGKGPIKMLYVMG